MDSQELVERIHDHVESGAVDKATIACLRLARAIGDVFNSVMFLRELHPDRKQIHEAFFEETRHLKKDAREFLWESTTDRWIEERSFDYSFDSENDEKNVLGMGVGELIHEVELMEKWIQDLKLPNGMGEFDTAAFTDRHTDMKSQMRLKIRACHSLLERIRTRCLNYATRVEGQLRAAEQASSFIGSVQLDVHNYYAARSDSAYRKLRKAAALIDSSESEDHAFLLTSIRRAVKAVADYHYPPSGHGVVCSDGRERVLDDSKYLNRLQEFCAREFPPSTSTSLFQSELEYFSVFVHRLNSAASKGVHAEVTQLEAKQGLLGLYMLLSNLIAKLSAKPEERTEDSQARAAQQAVEPDVE